MADHEQRRCGTVAIVGRPNTGKSTLLNALIGQKISITSRKPQTTRFPILGITTTAEAQYLFLDTPGFQTQHRSALTRAMNRSVQAALAGADVVLWTIERLSIERRDRELLALLPPQASVIAVINKIDLLRDKSELLPHLQMLAQLREFAALVPVSAKQGQGLEDLLRTIAALLPLGVPLYGDEDITDRGERFLAAELIREKLFRSLGEEIPYTSHVATQRFTVEGALRRIEADIIVSRPSHKAIVIGERGEKLKAIASAARLDMERLFGGRVFLQVWVKVKDGWLDDKTLLHSFGYE
jgi:GTPase